MSRELLKEEAIRRLELLSKEYKLYPKLIEYLKADKIYYSYLTAMGCMASVDTVEYEPDYAKQISKFEKKTGYFVYHAIESHLFGVKTLVLLFVDEDFKENSDWKFENYIMSYVINIDSPELSEFGDVLVSGSNPSGALLRIG